MPQFKAVFLRPKLAATGNGRQPQGRGRGDDVSRAALPGRRATAMGAGLTTRRTADAVYFWVAQGKGTAGAEGASRASRTDLRLPSVQQIPWSSSKETQPRGPSVARRRFSRQSAYSATGSSKVRNTVSLGVPG